MKCVNREPHSNWLLFGSPRRNDNFATSEEKSIQRIPARPEEDHCDRDDTGQNKRQHGIEKIWVWRRQQRKAHANQVDSDGKTGDRSQESEEQCSAGHKSHETAYPGIRWRLSFARQVKAPLHERDDANCGAQQ